MNRRTFLAAAASSLAPAAAREKPVLILTAGEARRIGGARGGDSLVRKLAQRALNAGPWSVTFHRPAGVEAQAGPHDYYSEGPYWWPDPRNPGGAYIRKDGERNPNRFMGNRRDLGDLCEAVLALGMGSRLLGDAPCAARAGKVLSVWFLDPATRMNPNLEFGQAVRGHNTGRGIGIIDTVSLIYLVQGVLLMERAGKLDRAVSAGLRRWFADYLKWMTTSGKGLDEKKASNNHATWWTAQAAAYAWFVEDAAVRRMCWEHYRTHLIPAQVQPDGSCPREEARTRSLSYSAMNLDGFAVICRLAQMDGVDLWPAIEKSFRYLMPYVTHPERWRKPQITPFEPDRPIFPGLAGLRDKELLAAYRGLPRAEMAWVRLVDLLARG